jgi:hypothetical protein
MAHPYFAGIRAAQGQVEVKAEVKVEAGSKSRASGLSY